jgi:hypothetical protein
MPMESTAQGVSNGQLGKQHVIGISDTGCLAALNVGGCMQGASITMHTEEAKRWPLGHTPP